MQYEKLHDWNLGPQEAVKVQKKLKEKLEFRGFDGDPKIVAGVDLSFPSKKEGLAVIVLFEYPSMRVLKYVFERSEISFPYIPGLLAFREGPAFLKAWEKLDVRPDVVVFDGQGIAHPRGIGIASHMGLFIGLPTIGVAKSRLYGWHDEVPDEEWARSPLRDKMGKLIGYAVRTKIGGKPIYISPGHLIDVESSYRLIKNMTIRGKRIPEPTRVADILTKKLKKGLF